MPPRWPNLGGHLLPESWCFHASLSQASIESTAFHAFEHGLATQPDISRKNPSVCIVTIHDLGHVLRPCFVKSRLDIRACQVHGWSYHSPVSHHRIFFPLATPSVSVSCSSPITCKCWQLIQLIPPICSFFRFSGSFFSKRRKTHDAYHFDITDVGATALLKSTSLTTFHELGDETRETRRTFSRAARQAFIHDSATKHRPHLWNVGKCPPTNVPVENTQDSGVSPLSFDKKRLLRAQKAPCSLAVHLGAVVASPQSIQHRYLISLLSLSGTPQINECVAWAAARTTCHHDSRPSWTGASALACSFEKRLVHSLWDQILLNF